MYVQGVSTRKVKAITEELCGHSFSASSISAINQRLDASLAQFAGLLAWALFTECAHANGDIGGGEAVG
jgi:Transposase, Mutator family